MKKNNLIIGVALGVFALIGIAGTQGVTAFDQNYRKVTVDTLRNGFNASNTTGIFTYTMVSKSDTTYNLGNDTLRFKNVKSKYHVANDTSGGAFIIGAPNATSGSWRMIQQGQYLKFQRLSSGVWTTKDSIAP